MNGRAQAGAAAVAFGAPLLLTLGIALAAAGSGTLNPPPAQQQASGCGGPPVTAGKTVDGQVLTQSQISNAQVIYSVGASLHLPQRAEIIAIATAMQESRLENLPYGTSDSVGLFQQRPSQGWGTVSQIMQPVYASRAFYTSLVQVPGWQALPVTVAAQTVQRSAYPDAYAQWQTLATGLVETFTGSATYCLAGNDSSVPASGSSSLPKGFSLPAGTPVAVVRAIRYGLSQLGKPYVWGGTGPAGYDCSGLVMMAYEAAGIQLPRTTFEQVHSGTPVYSLSALKPGDLIFMAGSDGTSSSPGHVGMYIGSGLVLVAPHTGANIKLDPLSPYWSKNATAIRRVVG